MSALVTGGAKGLGAEICYALAKEGHSLLVHYRESGQEAERVAEHCRQLGVDAKTVQGDFSSSRAVERFLNKLPNIKFLINNVGIFVPKRLFETTQDDLQNLFQVNMYAALQITQQTLDTIKGQQGAIVNVGVAGLNRLYPDTYCPAYTASKLSLFLMTKSLARELAPFQVSVNMVSPGYLENSVVHPQQELPMRQPGKLSDAAQLIATLLRPESRYITGQNIEISGGVRL